MRRTGSAAVWQPQSAVPAEPRDARGALHQRRSRRTRPRQVQRRSHRRAGKLLTKTVNAMVQSCLCFVACVRWHYVCALLRAIVLYLKYTVVTVNWGFVVLLLG